MVPPAFPEVGQPVSERDLKQLEYDTVQPAHLNVPDDHHLKPPPEQMSEKVHINSCFIHIHKLALGILRSIYSAVIGIALLWKGRSEGGIKELEEFASIIKWLEENVNDEQCVHC